MSALGLPCVVRGVGVRTAWCAGADRAALGLRIGARDVRVARLDGRVRRLVLARGVPFGLRGVDRLIELAAPALREAARSHPGGTLALVLAAPLMAPSDASALLHGVAMAAGVAIDPRRSEVVAGGAAAGALAFSRAVALLGGARGPAHVVVGGVASPVAFAAEVADDEPGLVARAARRGDAALGLLGEGAGFLVLSARGETRARLVEVIALPEPTRARWRAALRDVAAGGPLTEILGDLDVGGDGGADLATSSTRASRGASLELEAGAVLGDLEAAGPAVLAALALSGRAVGQRGRAAIATGATRGPATLLVVEWDAEATLAPPPPAPRAAPSSASLAARVLWHELLTIDDALRAIALRDEDAAASLAAALQAAARCDLALRELGCSDLLDPAHLAKLDGAAAALDALAAAVPAGDDLAPLDDDAALVAAEAEAARRGGLEGALALRRMRDDVVGRAAALVGVSSRTARAPVDAAPRVALAIEVEVGAPPLFPAVLDEAALRRAAGALDAPASTRAAHEHELAVVEVLAQIAGVRIARGPGPAADAIDPAPGFVPTDLEALVDLDRALDQRLAALGALARPGAPDGEDGVSLVCIVEASHPARSPEPSSAFVRSFVLGSISDPEGARRACAALSVAPAIVLAAAADGLALARGPAVDEALDAQLVRAHDPAQAWALARALTARRAVRVGTFALHLASPAPRLRAAVARGLGFAADPVGAASALLAAARSEPDAAALAAQLEALVRLGAPEGLVRTRIVLDDGDLAPAAFLRLLALAGRAEDIERLQRHPEEEWAVRGLGWLGLPGLAPVLTSILDRERVAAGDEPSATALLAAQALQRMAGASPSAGKLVWKEQRTVDPRGLEVSSRRWTDYLARAAHDPRVRLRFGRPHDHLAPLAEVEAPAATARDRDDAAFEAAAISSGALRLRDVADSAPLQRALLELARSA